MGQCVDLTSDETLQCEDDVHVQELGEPRYEKFHIACVFQVVCGIILLVMKDCSAASLFKTPTFISDPEKNTNQQETGLKGIMCKQETCLRRPLKPFHTYNVWSHTYRKSHQIMFQGGKRSTLRCTPGPGCARRRLLGLDVE